MYAESKTSYLQFLDCRLTTNIVTVQNFDALYRKFNVVQMRENDKQVKGKIGH
jgi:hypothetical protein